MAIGIQSTKELLKNVKKIIPPLLERFHKGQAGRIAVIGGCEDYTGAPFFSGIASTLLGADMSHVICEHDAGTVIKTYSPNLMVHPYLYSSRTVPKDETLETILPRVDGILDRVHVVVVGPGLGRDKLMLELVERIIMKAKDKNMPIVIDADGLYLVQQNVDIIKGYKHAILTPNVVEFKRLQKAVGIESNGNDRDACLQLAQKLGIVLVQKGKEDIISNGEETIKCDIEGTLKRVSGQGDTLSGTMSTFLAWKLAYQNKLWDHPDDEFSDNELMLLSAFGACSITRHSAKLAFEQKHRAMVTSDISNHIGTAYCQLFESKSSI